MPHCTTNFGWYLGKFLVGFTGMLFFYTVFLKEREYRCLCKARMRQFLQRRGGKQMRLQDGGAPRRGSGFWRTIRRGSRRLHLRSKEACLKMTMVISTSPANRCVSLVNCVCPISLLNKKIKPTESTTSIRKKRQIRQCLFRHCSGLVCAEKLLKKKRNRQRSVHLRVSQETVHDYWNIRDTSMHDREFEDRHGPDPRGKKDEKVVQRGNEEHRKIEGEEISKRKDDCVREIIILKQLANKEKPELVTFFKSPRVRFSKRCSDQDLCRTTEANVAKGIGCDKAKPISNRGNENVKKGIDLYPNNNTSSKKCSQSGTSFSDNCGDSILYRQLRRTCVRSVETELPVDRSGVDKTIDFKLAPMTGLGRIDKISTRLEDVNRTVNNFLDDVRTFSFKQKQEYNLHRSINNRESSSRLPNKFPSRNIENAWISQQESTSPVSWHKSTTCERSRKYLCQDCYCESKTRNYNDTRWSSSRKRSSSPRMSPYSSHHTRYRYPQRNDYSLEALKARKRMDFSPRQKFDREKPMVVIYKNKKSNKRNAGSSAYSLSSSPHSSRCSTCKSSPFSVQSSDRYKRSGNSTGTDSDFLISSTSSFSSKRCQSCSLLSQNTTNREKISSSSCAKRQWANTSPRENEGIRSSPCFSSTSSPYTLSSMSTFRNDYNSKRSNGEPKKVERPWIDEGYCKPKAKRILCREKCHVRWYY